MNTVKTMILVSASFAVCWLPGQLYTLLELVEVTTNFSSASYYVTMFVAFFNPCLNPFVYAVNYDVIKQQWRHFGTCYKKAPLVEPLMVMTVQTVP